MFSCQGWGGCRGCCFFLNRFLRCWRSSSILVLGWVCGGCWGCCWFWVWFWGVVCGCGLPRVSLFLRLRFSSASCSSRFVRGAVAVFASLCFMLGPASMTVVWVAGAQVSPAMTGVLPVSAALFASVTSASQSKLSGSLLANLSR